MTPDTDFSSGRSLFLLRAIPWLLACLHWPTHGTTSSVVAPSSMSGNYLNIALVTEDFNGGSINVGSAIVYSTYCVGSPTIDQSYLVYLYYDSNYQLRLAEEPCHFYYAMDSLSADDLQTLEDGACV